MLPLPATRAQLHLHCFCLYHGLVVQLIRAKNFCMASLELFKYLLIQVARKMHAENAPQTKIGINGWF